MGGGGGGGETDGKDWKFLCAVNKAAHKRLVQEIKTSAGSELIRGKSVDKVLSPAIPLFFFFKHQSWYTQHIMWQVPQEMDD